MTVNLNLNYDIFSCALVPMEQEHHDRGTGTGRDEPTSTQGAEATGIHNTTIAMIFYSFYHNYTGSLSTDIPPDAAMSLAQSGKPNINLQKNVMS